MYYVMTGETFDGKKAAEMGIVNEAVPRAKLKERTRALAKVLLGKNPDRLARGKTGGAPRAGHAVGDCRTNT